MSALAGGRAPPSGRRWGRWGGAPAPEAVLLQALLAAAHEDKDRGSAGAHEGEEYHADHGPDGRLAPCGGAGVACAVRACVLLLLLRFLLLSRNQSLSLSLSLFVYVCVCVCPWKERRAYARQALLGSHVVAK